MLVFLKNLSKPKKIILTVSSALVLLIGCSLALYFSGVINIPALHPSETATITDPLGSVQHLTLDQMKSALTADTFYPGIRINGIDVGGKTKTEAKSLLSEQKEDAKPDIALVFSVDGQTYPLDSSTFTKDSDLDSVLDEAYAWNRPDGKEDESAISDLYSSYLALKDTPKDFTSGFQIDQTELEAAVRDLLSPLEQEAKDATASSFDVTNLCFVIEDSVDGLTLDIDQAVQDAESAIDDKEYDKTIEVSVEKTLPKVSKADLESKLGLVSTFTTKTSDKPNRNSNINLVCKTIDGLVLQPGESFDFNQFIGKRTSEKGYKEAPGIYEGTLRQELGGGICQTTGTLYHSVLMADLQVDIRKPHSWPSDYVDIGTDATVTWGGADFKFTNNTEYPVAIHSYYNDRHITMEVYGRALEDGTTIKVIGVVNSRSAPGAPEYVADPTLPAGKQVTDRTPHDAISATCYKIYYDKNGTEIKREKASSSSYRAIPAKIRVGVLAADGSICSMDPATGAVNVPATPTTPAEPTSPTTPTPETPTATPVPTEAPATPAPTAAPEVTPDATPT